MGPSTLANQVVLVTGGGRGIGRATALAFAAQGAHVVITARSEDELRAVRREIRAHGVKGLAIPADVAKWREVRALVERAQDKLGAIDVLVNNAGVLQPIAPFWQAKPSAWHKNIDVNLASVFNTARAIVPSMLKRGAGAIINVSSGAGRNARYGWSAYCAAKAGLDHLTRVMALELKEHGVRVNGVYPGIVETTMQQTIRATDDDAMGGGVDFFRERFERGENYPPERPARLIVWLAQQQDISGQILDINDPNVQQRMS